MFFLEFRFGGGKHTTILHANEMPALYRQPFTYIAASSTSLTLYGHIKTAEQRTSNTVIGTLAVDWWAVTFSTARRGLGGLGPRPVSSLYQM